MIIFRINAGISHLVDKQLVADPRTGKLEVLSDQDNLVHLTWTERLPDGGALYSDGKLVEPEVECIVMPGTSATFELIQGRRVWVMKYEEQQYFFWAQEPDSSQDSVVAETITTCLNAGGAAAESDSEDEDTATADVQPEMSGLVAKRLAEMLGSIQCPPRQPATSSAAAAPSASAPAVDARALAAALGSISSGQVQMQRAPGPNLADVLTPEVIIPLLRQPGVLERLAPHLPEEHRNDAALMELAASAQLRHQLYVLGAALQTAQLDPSQFGLSAAGYTVADFLESIQKKVDEEGSATRQA